MDATREHPLDGVAHYLLKANLLTEKNLIEHQLAAKHSAMTLLHYLIHHNILCPKLAAKSIARQCDLPFIDLDTITLSSIPWTLIDTALIQRHRLIPLFHQDHTLHVALDDPCQYHALKDVQFHTGLTIIPVVVEAHKLTTIMNTLLNQKENQGLADYVKTSQDTMSMITDISDEASHEEPVVQFVKRILLDALNQGASDIHIEVYNNDYRIRYRQDGLLMTIATPPHSLSTRIAARIKIMANLDISERRIPQDGHFQIKQGDKPATDFRVSTCPTVGGEKIVIRILDTTTLNPHIDTLGFHPAQKTCFLNAINRPQGMILVTGPTGCGKTMTLYAALKQLNTEDKNVSTVEDPVEINIHGVNQVTINLKAGLTFSGVLRAFLRQDPDIIMIGEMRDLETAEIAVKAAQTGHLVLSTLHTNSAVDTLTRLLTIGIPAFNIASSVSLIVAQRLVRRLCENCKSIRDDLTPDLLTALQMPKTVLSYQAQGCSQCTKGYRGRIAIYEVMPISKHIAKLINSNESTQVILEQAQTEGMLSLQQAGVEHVLSGLTSIEELYRMRID